MSALANTVPRRLGLLGFLLLFLAQSLALLADVSGDLITACDKGDVAAVKDLIENHAANPNAMQGGYTALDSAVDGHNSEALVNLLIAHHVNVNLSDQDGSSPLLHGCNTNHTEAVLALLAAGADPNSGSNWGRYPLMYAAKAGNVKIVSALLDHQANPNVNCSGGPPIVWAILCNSDVSEETTLEMVKLLVNHNADLQLAMAINPDDPYSGANALIAATGYGLTSVVQFLLDHKAETEATGANGTTALMRAAAKNQLNIVKMLLEHRANLNATDAQGETALTYAGNGCHVEIVEYLKQQNALRTDVHIFPGKKRTDPLPPAQSWGLALGAIYTQVNGLDHGYLGGLDNSTPDQVKKTLADSWVIKNADDLRAELNNLLTSGHHEHYTQEGKRWAEMSDTAFAAELVTLTLTTPGGATRARLERQAYQKWKDKDAVAWDLCRYVMLVNDGYTCGYLKEAEAWSLIHSAAVMAQQTFGSWKEWGDNFLDGREIWDEKRDPKFEFAVQLLTNPNDPNSPWNQNVWATDLGSP